MGTEKVQIGNPSISDRPFCLDDVQVPFWDVTLQVTNHMTKSELNGWKVD